MNIGIQWLLGASEILSYFGNLGHISHLAVPCTYLLRIQQQSHSKIQDISRNDACSKLTANPSRTTYLQDWRGDRQKKTTLSMQSQRLRIGTGRFQVQLVNVQDFGWQTPWMSKPMKAKERVA